MREAVDSIQFSVTSFQFFFNGAATTEIYTLSLHDALPILPGDQPGRHGVVRADECAHVQPALQGRDRPIPWQDRKSTRLNSSHVESSYAVFCWKKKNGTPETSCCPVGASPGRME